MALLAIVGCAENGTLTLPTDTAPPRSNVSSSATPVASTELPRPTASSGLVALPTPTTTSNTIRPATSSPTADTTGTATTVPAPMVTVSGITTGNTPAPTVRVKPDATSVIATSANTPTPVTPPTLVPTSTATPTSPPYHFVTQAAALAGATELGCSGWNQAVVDGISYYRACASAAIFAQLVADPAKPVLGVSSAATPTPITTSALPTSTSTASHTVLPTSVQQPTSTPPAPLETEAHPPPHHFLTLAGAEAGSEELGCTGHDRVSVEGVIYYRACASDAVFEQLSSGAPTTISGAPCTLPSDATVPFNASPTDLSQIGSIVPAGSPSGGVIKPHSYLHNKDVPGTIKNVRVPVYAVADSVLSSVAYYDTSVGTSEYLIFFDVTCEISFKYDHLMELAPKLAAVAPAVPVNTSQTTNTPPIALEAGELIGYTSGAGGQGAWDFGAYDTTHTNLFANQERYIKGMMGQSLHTVCPYDYFTEPLKAQLYALLGSHNQRVLSDVECTTTQRDVLGAVAGAWFTSPILEFSDADVAIAMLPGETVAVTGIGSDLRIDFGQPTWLDPELLTTSHCYAGDGRWFFIEIQAEGMQMAIATGTGTCPNSLPSNATVYYR